MRIKQRPITLQRHADIPQRPAYNTITTALGLQQGQPLLRQRGVQVLASRAGPAMEELLDCAAAKHEARTSVGEICLDILLDVLATGRGGAHVEGSIGVEGLEESEDVVPEDVTGICLVVAARRAIIEP